MLVGTRKLIGGQYFINGFEAAEGPLNFTATGGYRSARDAYGHGTHCASIAGGNFAPGASFVGFAPGTAKGGAPLARVAVYKVCWRAEGACYAADVLAAFDKGISDGVDVFSVSIRGGPVSPLENAIAVGAFHANLRNISVVAAGGNEGPTPKTVANGYPWLTTVGASAIDRNFPNIATLGNGVSVTVCLLRHVRQLSLPAPLALPRVHRDFRKCAKSSSVKYLFNHYDLCGSMQYTL